MDTRNFSMYIDIESMIEEISDGVFLGINGVFDKDMCHNLIIKGTRFGYFSYHKAFPPQNLEDIVQWFDCIDHFIKWFKTLNLTFAEQKFLEFLLAKPEISEQNGKFEYDPHFWGFDEVKD